MGRCETYALLFFILISFYPVCILPQLTTQPVNVGLIVALPWDISNTLRAPLGGPVSIALSVIMAGILLFGLLLAPVNYILGFPSRIYHPARNPGLIETMIYQKKREKWNKTIGRSLDEMDIFAIDATYTGNLGVKEFSLVESEMQQKEPIEQPDFLTSAFYFIPEEDEQCRKLILCHAHGFLKMFPDRFKRIVRFFSKRSISIPEEYKTSVLLGLRNQSQCRASYKCAKDLTSILKDVLYTLLSSDLKALWKLQKLF